MTRRASLHLFALLLLAAGGNPGCNPGAATPTFPTPNVRVGFGDPFVLRVGDLGLVAGTGSYLYLSVLSLGLDSRCPEGATCAEPGFLDVSLEVETAETRTTVRMQAPPQGEATRTFGDFEIRILRVAPEGSAERIPTVDYRLLLSVTLKE